jgi:DnaJ-class molecular chaperone
MLQALECLRIVVSDRTGVAAHRVLRLPSKASAATEVKSAKRSIARRVHPDKVGAEWARSVCEEATRVINALR